MLLGSGGQASVDFDEPEEGELLLMCHLPGHVEKGMVGQVRLTALEGPASSGG